LIERGAGDQVASSRRLDGRVALIVGGGSAAGAAIARRCAALGASVMIGDIDFALAGKVAESLRAAGGAALAHRCDVAAPEQVDTMMARVRREFNALDVVVNNAGAWLEGDPRDHWARIVGVNLLGAMQVTRAALAAMESRGGGSIVNIAAMAGLGFAPSDRPAYAAAKAGIMRFTSALSSAHVARGIRVNCVAPDVIESEQDFAQAVVDLALREDCAGRVLLYRGGARQIVAADDPGYRHTESF
jgi:NAD(P)-dependent dehydrogenase (short-subunit alcohol dehydrogenase family)